MNMFKKQCVVFTTLVLMFTASWYTASASADVNVVVPFYTKHIQYNQDKTYTEDFDNHSLGLEYENGGFRAGSTYVHHNSHSRHSLYNHMLGMYTLPNGVQVGGGAFVAFGGYDLPMIAAPLWAAQYGWLRMTTTYPVMKATSRFSSNKSSFDLLNVQLIIPLR